jgi:hypothetical protein
MEERMEGWREAGSMNREQRRDSSQQRNSSSSRVACRREPRAASGIQSDKRANWTVRGREGGGARGRGRVEEREREREKKSTGQTDRVVTRRRRD